MKNSLFCLIMFKSLLFVLLNVSLVFSAEIEIDDQAGVPGDIVTFKVSIENAPADIRGMQFNIKFDSDILSFEEKEDGNLASNFDQFNVATDPTREGVLIVAGVLFGSGIPEGTTGDIVNLRFSVNLCQDTGLELIDLKGDNKEFSTRNGQFTCTSSETTAAPEVTVLMVSPTTATKSFSAQIATVKALDQNGQPMAGATINASAEGKGATVRPSSTMTNAEGETQFEFKFGFLARNGMITFTANGLTATITQR